ncbi:MAG: DUF4962 domain-containing protein [Planctomycetota bacterium]|nr:DUF4962 domain-containing protein [Planctomycetota bacterium]
MRTGRSRTLPLLGAVLLAGSLRAPGAEPEWVVRPEMRLPPGQPGADGLERGPLPGPIGQQLKGVHPRILFTAERLEQLKALVRTQPDYQALYKNLLSEADYCAKKDPPDTGTDSEDDAGEELWQRKVGKAIPNLALAYLLSGDAKYLAAAKKHIEKSLSYKTWGQGKFEGCDLAAGHQLLGIALGYDWLHAALSPEERARIREGLAARARTMASKAAGKKVWWHSAYLQNHLCVNGCGLATAGFALYDEDPDAGAWVRFFHAKLLTVMEHLMPDGTSHEGYGYWSYGIQHLLQYLEQSRDLLGIDLYRGGGVEHPWLKRGAAYALYLAAPRGLFKDGRRTMLNFADCSEQGAQPTYIARILAARYPSTPWAGAAQWLANELQAAGADATWQAYYLNLACYDPRVAPAPPDRLPTQHRFDNLDLAVSRSGWDGRESVLAVKCGPPEGHKNLKVEIANSGGHAHPDAGHFIFVARGAFLCVDDGGGVKQTARHSTLLVDGKGQKGDAGGEFDMRAWWADPRAPRIVKASSTPAEDLIECDVAPAYPPERGVAVFRRAFKFAKPDVVLLADHVETRAPAALEWRFHAGGQLEKVSENVFRAAQGEAVLELCVLEPAGLRATIGKLDGRKDRSYLSLAPAEKTAKADLKVIFRARDAKDATPFQPVLEKNAVRVNAGGKSLNLTLP